ncbi:hypothetical protein ACFLUV_00640 [Elusimicrobiota bacterium]
MKKGKNNIILNFSSIIVSSILLYNAIALTENICNNYCREAGKAEQELTEISRKGEKYSHTNQNLDIKPEYIISKTRIDKIIIVSHSIIYHDNSVSEYVLAKELPKRAPPLKI